MTTEEYAAKVVTLLDDPGGMPRDALAGYVQSLFKAHFAERVVEALNKYDQLRGDDDDD